MLVSCRHAGLRPIANLGSNSVAVFPGTRTCLPSKRSRRHEKVKLVFKPVNKQLQSVLQVLLLQYCQQLCIAINNVVEMPDRLSEQTLQHLEYAALLCDRLFMLQSSKVASQTMYSTMQRAVSQNASATLGCTRYGVAA